MPAATRLYVVKPLTTPNSGTRLICASNPAAVVRFMASAFTIGVATPKQVAELVVSGVKVEVAQEGAT